ncbi:unnamed protein product [Symbiodinium natans]|uniref:Uncharacterized protein n=1 Tax=Symbiodinium natans TaxID=878477 RepID=A0A812K2B0_9DINO|nr:unnamed protein product [Symbiodinium natans]
MLARHGRPNNKKVESWANNLKKGNQLSLELLGKSSSSSTQATPLESSETFKELEKKFKELNSQRSKLRSNLDEFMLLEATIQNLEDPSWTKKLEEVSKARTILEEFLNVLRGSLAAGLPNDKQADCSERLNEVKHILEQSATHLKATGQCIRQVKSLLDG